jgi:cytochrome c-type biogenesis protein CcmH/NrfG
MSAYSFVAGLLSGIAAVTLALWLWRRHGKTLQRTSLPQTSLIAAGIVATFAIAATIIYLTISHPRTSGVAQVSPTAPHPDVGASSSGTKAQSMEAATAGLAARLARNGGTADEWELLARSYDFLGRPDDARQARAHEAQAPSSGPSGSSPSSAAPTMQEAMQGMAQAPESSSETTDAATDSALRAQIEKRLKSQPKDVEALLNLAALDMKQQQYGQARDVFAKIIAQKGMTANAWADYADVLAALGGGSLAGEAGQAIEHSLQLDPRNEKGLWLKASRAHQEHRYADALTVWKTLRASLPADSPDARLVDNNIAEATQLAGGGGVEPASGAPPVAVAVSGTVSIDSQLAKKVDPQATLFIYAKAVGSQGPPLAVMRTTAGAWPVRFKLDDSMAMIPSRRLSQFDQVVIEARVSRSGQATPATGDLYVTSEVIKPREGKPLTLVISHQIS